MAGVIMAVKKAWTFTREQIIQQLKDACDGIKENAADFIGNEEFPRNWRIIIDINSQEFPVVRLERESIPHIALKRLTNSDTKQE